MLKIIGILFIVEGHGVKRAEKSRGGAAAEIP